MTWSRVMGRKIQARIQARISPRPHAPCSLTQARNVYSSILYTWKVLILIFFFFLNEVVKSDGH